MSNKKTTRGKIAQKIGKHPPPPFLLTQLAQRSYRCINKQHEKKWIENKKKVQGIEME
jgi:hypothetical protein